MQLFFIQHIFVYFIYLICYFIYFWHCNAVYSNACSCYLYWCIYIHNNCYQTCIAISNEISIKEPFFQHCHSLHWIYWNFNECLCTFTSFVAFLQLFYVSCNSWCFLNDCWFGLAILHIYSFCKLWLTNWINNKNIHPWWWCDGVIWF